VPITSDCMQDKAESTGSSRYKQGSIEGAAEETRMQGVCVFGVLALLQSLSCTQQAAPQLVCRCPGMLRAAI
jgi:hypothetical protein